MHFNESVVFFLHLIESILFFFLQFDHPIVFLSLVFLKELEMNILQEFLIIHPTVDLKTGVDQKTNVLLVTKKKGFTFTKKQGFCLYKKTRVLPLQKNKGFFLSFFPKKQNVFCVINLFLNNTMFVFLV